MGVVDQAVQDSIGYITTRLLSFSVAWWRVMKNVRAVFSSHHYQSGGISAAVAVSALTWFPAGRLS